MKKIEISKAVIFSALIFIISFLLFVIYGMKVIDFYQPLNLNYLTVEDMKKGKFVKGTITDCVVVPLWNKQTALSGNDGELVYMFGPNYRSYTIPLQEGRYVKIWINDPETVQGMEEIVKGEQVKLNFVGKIREGERLNSAWYGWNPDFDQSKVTQEYTIWQSAGMAERNLFMIGLYGMMVAALLYHYSGGIVTKEVQPEPQKLKRVGYNKENELVLARKRVETLRMQVEACRKKRIRGMVCIILGCLIVFWWNLYEFKVSGIVLIGYGCKKWWDFFIHSEMKWAVEFARLFSIQTFPGMIKEEEQKIELLMQEMEKKEQPIRHGSGNVDPQEE